MEHLRLKGPLGFFLSAFFGLAPELVTFPQALNIWADLLLKFLSLVSMLLIIFMNLKKLRSNATP